jgi:hypothetical protein
MGLKIGSTGSDSKVRANSLNFLDSGTDLDIQGLDADLSLFSVELDESKIINSQGIKFSSRGYTKKFNKKYQVTAGDVRFGGRDQRTTVTIGEGKYDDFTLHVFYNNNLELGTWLDHSLAAVDVDPPVFDVFQTTAPGGCLYIGRDTRIHGFKINTVTAIDTEATKDDIVLEYWNGVEWKDCTYMNTMAERPFSYRDLSPLSYQEKQHIRIGLKAIGSDMALKTVNNAEMYWIRWRIVHTISSIPQAQYIRTHVSESKFNGDGFLEYFGNARPSKRLPWTLGDANPANASPYNQDLYLSDTLNVGMRENGFQDGVVDRLGMNLFLPPDLDVSFPIKIKVALIGTSSGNGQVELICRWNTTNEGENVYPSTSEAPSTSVGEQMTSTIISISAPNTEYRGEIVVDLSRVNPAPETGTAELLTLSIERDARSSNSNDTYVGNVALEQVTPFYISWRMGGYLEAY